MVIHSWLSVLRWRRQLSVVTSRNLSIVSWVIIIVSQFISRSKLGCFAPRLRSTYNQTYDAHNPTYEAQMPIYIHAKVSPSIKWVDSTWWSIPGSGGRFRAPVGRFRPLGVDSGPRRVNSGSLNIHSKLLVVDSELRASIPGSWWSIPGGPFRALWGRFSAPAGRFHTAGANRFRTPWGSSPGPCFVGGDNLAWL